ncbi:Predicted esterase of the alpha/beta hydrolase fold [Chromobacterium violaceum]|uniref:Predicted esterase of the alpha/beta hydrolase fold n=1 Tax=Chromobacterium violaceum TaxID=536 RepID=A0A3S4IBZ7_CHRVL|nr:Predicted esterase of the alpha/beta hydrolase fold [Chromobacterium violaceum]
MFATLQPFDLIIQPGWNNSGPRHWQSHWQRRLGARRVDNADWARPSWTTGWTAWTRRWSAAPNRRW